MILASYKRQKIVEFGLVGLSIAAVAGAVSVAQALDPKTKDPLKIAQATEDRPRGDKEIAHMTMTLIDGSGRSRQRVLHTRSMKFAGGTKTLMLFESPADFRNTGLLSIDFDDKGKDDDQWLFIPDLHRATRVAPTGKSGSFLGTDISYADMTKRNAENYQYKLINDSEKIDGDDCWVLESTPKSDKEKAETGYTKSQLWISKKTLIPVQIKAWIEKGGKMKYIRNTEIKQVEGIWVPHKTTVRTMKDDKVESTTILALDSLKFNQSSVQDSDFTQHRLEQGL